MTDTSSTRQKTAEAGKDQAEGHGETESGSVTAMLESLETCADKEDSVSIGDVMEALGNRSYGPFLMVPALLGITPIGGIPGVPTFLSVIIILFAAQIVFGLDHLWIPGILKRQSIGSEKVVKSVETLGPAGAWMDRWFGNRLAILTGFPFVEIAAAACLLLALAIPPLEFLPFAVAAPCAAIAMFGLALLVNDGLVMIAAGLLTGLAAYIGFTFLGPNFL